MSSAFLTEYSGTKLIGTSVSFLVLELLVVTLRLYTRVQFTTARPGWDDYLVIPALIANLGLAAVNIRKRLRSSFRVNDTHFFQVLVTNGGVGRHAQYWAIMNPAVLYDWARILFVVELMYILAVCLSKLTILAIYTRVFTSQTTKFSLYTTYALIILVIGAWFGSTIASVFQCRSVGCQWSGAPDCECFDILAYFRYLSLPNIVTDAVMVIL